MFFDETSIENKMEKSTLKYNSILHLRAIMKNSAAANPDEISFAQLLTSVKRTSVVSSA